MQNYTSADEFIVDLKSSLTADTTNPVAKYALTIASTPKSILSKYTRCPKLKVETFSKTTPVWQGSIQFDGQTVPLSDILDQLQNLINHSSE